MSSDRRNPSLIELGLDVDAFKEDLISFWEVRTSTESV